MRRFATEMKAGGKLAGIEFGDPIKPFAAVWIHATGFNAMTYQSLLAPLGLRQRVAALDMRGHGRSTMPANPGRMKSWHRYRDDVIEWLEKEAPHGVVLSGHSMGATVALLVAGKRPDLVKGLVLADPVIMPRVYYFWKHVFPPVTWIANRNSWRAGRRNAGPSSRFPEALESYTGRGAFTSWREPFLADYLLDGIDRVDHNSAQSEEQVWRLTCDPKWESATFAAQRNQPWRALRKVRKHKIPIIVLRPNRPR
jgi:pimeloyl-ACP methyl ester carboxylesterase